MQDEILRTGTAQERRVVLEELLGDARACRIRYEAARDFLAAPGASEAQLPWREFRDIAGAPVLEALLAMVAAPVPSEPRAMAGDIMALLLHPSAIGRLLEMFEERRETLAEDPPVGLLRDLGGIGTAAAVNALVWLWGSGCDDEIAGALGLCDSAAAQDFLLRGAVSHENSYVRAVCMAHLKPPMTEEKMELFLSRLRAGTQNEQFVAVMKVKELRVARAVPLLVSLKAVNQDGILRKAINEALSVLR